MSLSSETDHGKTSFSNKTMQSLGDEVDIQECALGYTCRKGLKPESPNQDSWLVVKVGGNFSMYAVFDGHGKNGHVVSNMVKENLPKLIIMDERFRTCEMPPMLGETFQKMQGMIGTADRLQKVNAQMSGTTASLVIHDHVNNKLTISHVADSTVVLGRWSTAGRTKMEAVTLTRNHKPDLADERRRIESSGGRVVFDGVVNYRVYVRGGRYPGLNMSRCLGDLAGHSDCGLSCVPEVSECHLTPEDQVLLVCSDGVWEFITPGEAVALVSEYSPSTAMAASESLAKMAWDRWIAEEGGSVVDDITVVLVYLQHGSRPFEVPVGASQ